MSGVVSRMRRGLLWGLAAGVVLLMAGDHAMTASAANSGTDPFEILDLQIRPNAIIVLDSSGSMREEPTGTKALSGDDPNSKLGIAKRVLKAVVTSNKDKISFQFGQYEMNDQTPLPPAGAYTPTLVNTDRFAYVTDDATVAAWEVNRGGNGASQGGVSRRSGTDDVTTNGKTYYYLTAGKLFNGETVDISSCTSGTSTTDCGGSNPTVTAATSPGVVPPGTLWPDPAGGSFITYKRPYVDVKKGTTTVRFFFAGSEWNSGTGPCEGFRNLVDLASCTADGNVQVANISPYLDPEVFYDTGDGSILGYADGTLGSAPSSQPAIVNGAIPVGLRAESFTPIAGSLEDIRVEFWFTGTGPTHATAPPTQNYWTNKIVPQTLGRRQRTFVIFVTDGDDTCGGSTGDGNARLAARQAEALYKPVLAGNGGVNSDGSLKTTTDPASSVSTFLISFGAGADLTRANWIAWGGSGVGEGWTTPAINWTSSTNAALQTARDACVTCEDALTASTASELQAALQAAIDKGSAIGEFSSQSQGSVTDSVFEYVALAGAFDPLLPVRQTTPTVVGGRYDSSFPVTVRSTFKMPNFEGQLKAYDSSGTVLWDAGAKLQTNVLNVVGAGPWSFSELHGNSATSPYFIPAATAKIRRRIFTTSGNGVNPPLRTLWPPTTTDTGVAPNNTTTYPAGSLDGSKILGWGLGIGDLTFAELKAQYLACEASGATPTNLHADCSSATNQTARARKEAREILLAYTAGAKLLLSGGKPLRHATTKDLQYSARSWLLSESTISTPAFVGQPGELPSTAHQAEWLLYRDGPRNTTLNLLNKATSIEDGFGLRNPDRDDPAPDTTGIQEPVMTVVYVAANDMMHAFRAGPQVCTGTATCPTAGNEGGGEELWGFVPFDLLPKLTDKRRPQSRVDPTFMLSSSLRFGDVFVAGTYLDANSVSRAGKWRTMMFVGRGPGGKYMTALDITGPGPFTRKALATKLPTVLWNRGNPDSDDGLLTGPDNKTTNTGIDLGDVDRTAYATMGETWSVPSLVPVDPATADTAGKEWVLWMGSGFSDDAAEGRNFYTIDVVTGDILRTVPVGSATGATRTNFLSAAVAGFVPNKLAALQAGDSINAADGPATAAVVGDLHGRVFRFDATNLAALNQLADYGTDQPIGVAVAALDIPVAGISKPYVYGVTGADNRIFDPKGVPLVATPPFKLFGLRDDGGAITDLFTVDFPERFRGSTQPLAGVDSNAGRAVVFFIGTQFNPAGTAPPPAEPCVSSFDSIIFALDHVSGNAVYDLSLTGDDRSAIWRGQKVQNITARNKQVVLDTGLNAGGPPPAPPPPAPQGNSAVPSVFTTSTRYGSPVCKW